MKVLVNHHRPIECVEAGPSYLQMLRFIHQMNANELEELADTIECVRSNDKFESRARVTIKTLMDLPWGDA